MPVTACTLIHTALLSEAKPIISHFQLRQFETQPYKIFRGKNIVLIVSGPGRENTRRALELICEKESFKTALNVGTAGCSDPDVPKGSLCSAGNRLGGLPSLPLITGDAPVTRADTDERVLFDMEADAFTDVAESRVHFVYVLKVVSDYLDDTIPKSSETEKLIAKTIPHWEYLTEDYPEKMDELIRQLPFGRLPSADRQAVRDAVPRWHLTHQRIRHLTEWALDFQTWDEPPLSALMTGCCQSFDSVKAEWERLKTSVPSYQNFRGISDAPLIRTPAPADHAGFGSCPVASSRTRCCNLLTLDAAQGCGFDCSYCSVRDFRRGKRPRVVRNLAGHLNNLEIDPDKTYHIGTGQFSDSLIWDNHFGILDALFDFAGSHPNVILELKTKSGSADYLLNHSIPPNVITTWSLNTPVIVQNEEHLTASPEERLNAAAAVAERGGLVGFHLHPMVHYQGWERDYDDLLTRLRRTVRAESVVMMSFGTLTFIKPVIKKIRERNIKSRILQMPLSGAAGKYSYPADIKIKMFRFARDCMKDWEHQVFFYLCMEDAAIWPDVFGYEYADNQEFENAMLDHYRKKIRSR